MSLERKAQEDMTQADSYLDYTVFNNLLQLRRLKLIVEQVMSYSQLRESNKLKILEIGCGIGAISFPISSLGHSVTGVDIDENSITVCNAKNPFPDARYLVGDGETLDLPDEFDIVIASEVMEHCPKPELILKTLSRHLKKDGMGIVTVPNGYCINELLFSRLFQKLGITPLFHKLPKSIYTRLTGSPSPYYSENIFCHHVQFFSLGIFSRLLISNGFEIVLIRDLDLGLFLDWTCLNPLKRMEFRLSDYTPHAVAGGWVFVIRRKGENIAR